MYYGINVLNPSSSPTIRNNTIVHNTNEGIRFVGSHPPTVRNNILYYNNENEPNGLQLAGLNEKQLLYCCLPDCNDVNIRHNINDEPVFAYSQPPYGYYHLRSESPCIDKGDPSLSYDEQVDIDNQPREMGLEADIGADEVEVSCTDTWNENDWTYDGTINFEEFAIFSSAWKTHDPNDPGLTTDPNFIGYPNYVDSATLAYWRTIWNPKCNLDTSGDSEYAIDLSDLIEFCVSWLWRACWYDDYSVVMYGQSYSGGGESMLMSMPMAEPDLFAEAETLYEQPMQTETETLSEQSTQTETVIPAEAGIQEKSIEEQIIDLKDAIGFLEALWLEDEQIQKEIQVDDWQEFMNAVYNSLTELEESDIITQEVEAEQ